MIVAGRFGYVAKGIALGIVGGLFVAAAATADSDKAEGLDGALKSLVGVPGGQVVLIAIGAGLILYGLFCLARARTTARKGT